MTRTLYRIYFRVVESNETGIGTRVVEVPVAEYVKVLRKEYPDASTIYIELLEEFEDDDDQSATARESVIILG